MSPVAATGVSSLNSLRFHLQKLQPELFFAWCRSILRNRVESCGRGLSVKTEKSHQMEVAPLVVMRSYWSNLKTKCPITLWVSFKGTSLFWMLQMLPVGVFPVGQKKYVPQTSQTFQLACQDPKVTPFWTRKPTSTLQKVFREVRQTRPEVVHCT